MRTLLAGISGGLFGAGLTVSGMTDPAKVRGFLDVFGSWDPTLMFVMAAALAVALPVFQWSARRARPLLDAGFHPPQRSAIDRDLLLGAVLFGIGWGVAGFCPGPAIAGLASASPQIAVFVLAMCAGIALRSWRVRRSLSQDNDERTL